MCTPAPPSRDRSTPCPGGRDRHRHSFTSCYLRPVIPLQSDSESLTHRHESPRSSLGRCNLTFDASSLPSVHRSGFRTTPSSGLVPVPAFTRPVFPSRGVSFSSSPPYAGYAFPSSIGISCVFRSPGLLVCLHFVSILSVLPFRTWLAVCLRIQEPFPARSYFPLNPSSFKTRICLMKITRESSNLTSYSSIQKQIVGSVQLQSHIPHKKLGTILKRTQKVCKSAENTF